MAAQTFARMTQRFADSAIWPGSSFSVDKSGMIGLGWNGSGPTALWGKIIGGVAGFAMGGPFGAVVGAALGHAADNGGLEEIKRGFGRLPAAFGPARLAAVLGQRDQVFAVSVVVLSAKLSKCDGPVNRAEIDAFKRSFRIPPQAARDIGRLFDSARDSPEGFEEYATQLGQSFEDTPGVLEDVLAALFQIARADKPVTVAEHQFLLSVCHRLGLGQLAWERASAAAPRRAAADSEDPYEVLGVERSAGGDEIRAVWKKLMRDNHPDSLASRGVPQEFITRATEKVSRINAAWDRIKRERGL
jgi:DnaJ like chaperone protein